MCQIREIPRYTDISACTCGCCGCGCGCGPGFRRFFSSKEEQECLENYKKQLTKELEGIAERIRELRDKG